MTAVAKVPNYSMKTTCSQSLHELNKSDFLNDIYLYFITNKLFIKIKIQLKHNIKNLLMHFDITFRREQINTSVEKDNFHTHEKARCI